MCYGPAAMERERLKELLAKVRDGKTDVDSACDELRHLPFADLGYAVVDHHRALRQGAPEVVFGEGKTVEQITGIVREIASKGSNVLVTRVAAEKAVELLQEFPRAKHSSLGRTLTLEQAPIAALGRKPVALWSAGTSDLPVVEECAETLRLFGAKVERVHDVGVAGIHRLFARQDKLAEAGVVIVVAGMEGALPSVIGGLVSVPVIAVPTSIGYGAAFQGLTPLLCMLTSCASGITVVNIDNGFGAAFAAARILRST